MILATIPFWRIFVGLQCFIPLTLIYLILQLTYKTVLCHVCEVSINSIQRRASKGAEDSRKPPLKRP